MPGGGSEERWVAKVGLYLEKNIKPPDLIYVFRIIIL